MNNKKYLFHIYCSGDISGTRNKTITKMPLWLLRKKLQGFLVVIYQEPWTETKHVFLIINHNFTRCLSGVVISSERSASYITSLSLSFLGSKMGILIAVS